MFNYTQNPTNTLAYNMQNPAFDYDQMQFDWYLPDYAMARNARAMFTDDLGPSDPYERERRIQAARDIMQPIMQRRYDAMINMPYGSQERLDMYNAWARDYERMHGRQPLKAVTNEEPSYNYGTPQQPQQNNFSYPVITQQYGAY